MDKTVQIKLANLNIMLTSGEERVYQFLQDYISESDDRQALRENKTERIDIVCSPTQCDIKKEIEKADEPISQSYAEIICIYRKLAEQLPYFEKFVCHGAAISYKGNGYIFIAPSNTGKSTHIKLWKDVFPKDTVIINGDKPIIDLSEEETVVWGTPWAGKEGWNNNTKAPLKGICLIRRGTENHIKKEDPGNYISEVYQQAYRPDDKGALKKTIELLNALFKKVPFYVLDCNMQSEAAIIAREYLMGSGEDL